MNRLREAFDAEPVPRDLEARVRAHLDHPPMRFFPRMLPSFALLAVLVVSVQGYSMYETRNLLSLGVADHRHCAIEGAYPRQSERAEMVSAMGPYSVMLQPILDQMPGDEVVSAHRCTIDGRQYMHVVLRRRGTLLSVTMTKRREGEFYPRSVINLLSRKGSVPVRDANLDNYSAAGFTAGGYFGYVVSTLPAGENREMAEKLAPVFRKYTGA